MADLPQLQDAEPQLQVQQVNSEAKGLDAFSSFLGSLSKEATDQAVQINDNVSNAQLMQASTQAEQIKTQATVDMIQHPNDAAKIGQNSLAQFDTIKNNTQVNNQDRPRLDYLLSGAQDDIKVKAAQTSYDQSVKAAGINFWDNYPVVMNNITQALDSGDMKTAKILEDKLHATALSAAQINAITPEQFGTVRKASFDLYQRTQDLMSASQNPDGITAAQYQAMNASPFGNTPFSNINAPVDANTQALSDHYNADRSFQSQLDNLTAGRPVNLGAVASATDDEYNKFKLTMAGVNTVKGMIGAGTPFTQIQQQMDSIAANPNPTIAQSGALKYWKNVQYQLNNQDGFYAVMGQTTQGAQYTAQHAAQKDAIQTSYIYNPSKVGDALRDNDNNYIHNMIALGKSMHVDPAILSKAIPSEYMQDFKSSFVNGAPVLPAIQRLNYLDPELRAYAADQMPKSNQAMTLFIAGNTLGKTDPGFQADLITANQERVMPNAPKDQSQVPTSLIINDQNNNHPNDIWTDLLNYNSNMKTIYQYLGRMPNARYAQDGFKQSALNYIYYRAQKAGDAQMTNLPQYESDFVSNTEKGFNFYNTDRAMFNLNDLGIVRQQDADALANYALANAYRVIQQGRTPEDAQRYIDLNPMMAFSTPDKRIVVLNNEGRAISTPDGKPAFDQPFTSKMLSAANQLAQQDLTSVLPYYGIKEKIIQQAQHGLIPNISLHESLLDSSEGQ